MFVGVDWGTTNFRAYLFDGETVIDQIESDQGILNVSNFRDGIDGLLQCWESVPVVFSGMIGSSKGWYETPYQRVPISYSDIAGGLCDISSIWGREAYILGGLDQQKNHHNYDVMRGEEVQIIGLRDHIIGETTVILCGTHSKHVSLNLEGVTSFQTFLTGELFSLLQKHSILAGPIEYDEKDFLLGVKHSQDATLLTNLFSVRSLFLSQSIQYPRAFLSGLLIGTELRTLRDSTSRNHLLIGSSSLIPFYEQAYETLFSVKINSIVSDDCNVKGYITLAKYLGWLE